jgi:hypothetical protein
MKLLTKKKAASNEAAFILIQLKLNQPGEFSLFY